MEAYKVLSEQFKVDSSEDAFGENAETSEKLNDKK